MKVMAIVIGFLLVVCVGFNMKINQFSDEYITLQLRHIDLQNEAGDLQKEALDNIRYIVMTMLIINEVCVEHGDIRSICKEAEHWEELKDRVKDHRHET